MSNRTKKARRAKGAAELQDTIQVASTPRPQSQKTVNLTDLIEALRQSSLQRRESFKLPEYNGEGDIDTFLVQLEDVQEANNWTNKEALLHLRLSLKGKALDCDRGNSVTEITANLRARFGITSKQAREKLRHVRKTAQMSIQELGAEIEKLTQIAYPSLSIDDRNENALDVFHRAMDNRALRRHLLARPPKDVTEAVELTEEFLQVGGENRPTRITTVINKEDEELEDKEDEELEEQKKSSQTLIQALESIQAAMQQLSQPNRNYDQQVGRQLISCFECYGPHRRNDCPRKEDRQSGNDEGPVQPVAQLN